MLRFRESGTLHPLIGDDMGKSLAIPFLRVYTKK